MYHVYATLLSGLKTSPVTCTCVHMYIYYTSCILLHGKECSMGRVKYRRVQHLTIIHSSSCNDTLIYMYLQRIAVRFSIPHVIAKLCMRNMVVQV